MEYHSIGDARIQISPTIEDSKGQHWNRGGIEVHEYGYYWDEETMANIIDVLYEFQDLFSTKFSEMKGILGYLGEMKIPLKLDANSVKQCPYRLNP